MINGAIATIESPVAKPSSPSDKLTPLLVPANINKINAGYNIPKSMSTLITGIVTTEVNPGIKFIAKK